MTNVSEVKLGETIDLGEGRSARIFCYVREQTESGFAWSVDIRLMYRGTYACDMHCELGKKYTARLIGEEKDWIVLVEVYDHISLFRVEISLKDREERRADDSTPVPHGA